MMILYQDLDPAAGLLPIGARYNTTVPVARTRIESGEQLGLGGPGTIPV
ncbi:hypothetical protein AB0C34_19220 [Nocardia sp. NPDC049220]